MHAYLIVGIWTNVIKKANTLTSQMLLASKAYLNRIAPQNSL